MKTTKKILLTSVACAAVAMPFTASADDSAVHSDAKMETSTTSTTVTTQTYVEPQEIEGVNEIKFSDFDLNNDGLYSKSEVGEKLFYSFDRDGNEVIDNIEWNENLSTMTVTDIPSYQNMIMISSIKSLHLFYSTKTKTDFLLLNLSKSDFRS